MRPRQNTALDTEIEMTAQELLAPLGTREVIEIDDIIAGETNANADANTGNARKNSALDKTCEIELTADEMDAMLNGRWGPQAK